MVDFLKRVRTQNNEREERLDFDAVAQLVQAYLSESENADLGAGEGVLSRPEVVYQIAGAERRIRLGACWLYGNKPTATPSNIGDAAKIRYNPADPTTQPQSYVNVAGYEGSTCAIWWTVGVPTNGDTLANKRIWENGFPNGKIRPITTRYTPRVSFAVTADLETPPASGGPWYRMAAVDFPMGETPSVAFCHAMDQGFELSALAVAQTPDLYLAWPGQIALNRRNAVTNEGRTYGGGRLVSLLARVVLRMLHTGNTFDVETGEILTQAEDGLLLDPGGLDIGGIAQLNDALGPALENITALQARARTLAWFDLPTSSETPDSAGGDFWEFMLSGPFVYDIDRSTPGVAVFTFVEPFVETVGANPSNVTAMAMFRDLNVVGGRQISATIDSTTQFTVRTSDFGNIATDYPFRVMLYGKTLLY